MKIIQSTADIDEGVSALRLIDPRLEPVIERAGEIPLRLSEAGFAGLAHIIVSQMVSRASADAIWRRMVAGTEIMTAERFLAVDEAILSGFGLSNAKRTTLLSLASAVTAGELDLIELSHMEPTVAMQRLTALKGIGPWTAEVYLMFCGGHADIFPAGDVALQAAMMHAFALDVRPSRNEIAERARFWSPWQSVAARIFWAYYASITRRDALPMA
ncbi:DNA-3-methyladenine glycosylase family protein [Agrobacterium cavarae]|uniref:DNA-3-methyladenine glycosylase family protein n=1 Tax=Agrobacterium cavarae TaxID=2528239 RepID=UPI0028B258C7|nr:DNA-3-methyladenine glycosylase [Agrobacterium cavarae]